MEEGKLQNPLKGQSKSQLSPETQGGAQVPRGTHPMPSRWKGDLVANSWSHQCKPRAGSQQRGLGVDTASAKTDGVAASFSVNPDVCLR